MKDNDLILMEQAYSKLNEQPVNPMSLGDIIQRIGNFRDEVELNTYILENFKNGYLPLNDVLEYLGITQGDVFDALEESS